MRAVYLYAEISPEGIPQNLSVVGSLGPDLDQQAIECVKQWRFSPGREILATAITVNFRVY